MTNTIKKIFSRIQVNDTECWIWQGHLNDSGYPYVSFNGKNWRVHRLSYQTFVGRLNPLLELDHLCRNRACVNPDHLEQVTKQINIKRGGNHNREKTHCKRGHAFTSDNIYHHRGFRHCKICKREQLQIWRQNKRVSKGGRR